MKDDRLYLHHMLERCRRMLFLLGATAFYGAQQKPACNRASQSRFWPDAANYDSRLAREFMQRGELEMCTLGAWKYKWRLTNVNVNSMKRKSSSPDGVSTATK